MKLLLEKFESKPDLYKGLDPFIVGGHEGSPNLLSAFSAAIQKSRSEVVRLFLDRLITNADCYPNRPNFEDCKKLVIFTGPDNSGEIITKLLDDAHAAEQSRMKRTMTDYYD
jgi:hypothetical protein